MCPLGFLRDLIKPLIFDPQSMQLGVGMVSRDNRRGSNGTRRRNGRIRHNSIALASTASLLQIEVGDDAATMGGT